MDDEGKLEIASPDAARAMGITHNVGIVWYDRQPQSRRDYNNIIALLSALYRVPRSVSRYRLAEMGISRDYSPTGYPTKVGELLSQALTDLFSE